LSWRDKARQSHQDFLCSFDGAASFPTPVDGKRDSGDDESQIHDRLLPFGNRPEDDQAHDQQERDNGKERIERNSEDVCASDAVSPHFEKCQGGNPVKNKDGKDQAGRDGLKGSPDNENGSRPQAVRDNRPGWCLESRMDVIQPFKEEPVSGHGIIGPCRGHHSPVDASRCGDNHEDGDAGGAYGAD